MEKKTSKNILLIIMGVLILAELIASVICFLNQESLISGIIFVPLVFTALYGFWLYRKPHGNMLKYAMLFLAATQMLVRVRLLVEGHTNGYIAAIGLLCAGMVIYVAGRLNRIEQNKYILVVATIIIFICGLTDFIPDIGKYSPLILFSYFYESIMLLTLMIDYFVRYKEHKEAGLMDAPKK